MSRRCSRTLRLPESGCRDRLRAAQRRHLLRSDGRGDQLQALLAAAPGGQLTLSWKATASSPYVYNLGFTQSTPLTDDKTFVVRDKKLGRTEADYKGMGVDTRSWTTSTRAATTASPSVSPPTGGAVATKRTGVLHDGGTKWLHFLTSSFPFRRGDGRRLAHLPGRQCPH